MRAHRGPRLLPSRAHSMPPVSDPRPPVRGSHARRFPPPTRRPCPLRAPGRPPATPRAISPCLAQTPRSTRRVKLRGTRGDEEPGTPWPPRSPRGRTSDRASRELGGSRSRGFFGVGGCQGAGNSGVGHLRNQAAGGSPSGPSPEGSTGRRGPERPAVERKRHLGVGAGQGPTLGEAGAGEAAASASERGDRLSGAGGGGGTEALRPPCHQGPGLSPPLTAGLRRRVPHAPQGHARFPAGDGEPPRRGGGGKSRASCPEHAAAWSG